MNSEVKEILAPLDGVKWKIYMCTTEDQVLKLYREFGLDDQVPLVFSYHSKDDSSIIIAQVSQVCKEIFAQVVNMAYTVGFNPSYIYFEQLLRQFED